MTTEERLTRLEREVRRWRVTAGLVLLVGVGLALAGAKKGPGELTATKLTIVDAAGKMRAGLGVAADGVALKLTDAAGKTSVGVAVTADVGVLMFTDAAGKTRAALALAADRAGLMLADADGKPRAALAVDKDGWPALTLGDADGKPRAVLGRASLETINSGEETLTSEGSLVIFGKDGKVLSQLPR